MARTWILGLFVMVACGGKKQPPDHHQRCVAAVQQWMSGNASFEVTFGAPEGDPQAKCMRAHPDHPDQCMEAAEAEDYRRRMSEAIEKCATWPDDTLRCIEELEEEPACERAETEMAGLTFSEVKAEGPAPAWQVALDGVETIDLLYAGDGAVYAISDDLLIAVADGAERWRVEVSGLGGVAPGPCVVVLGIEELTCLDPVSGKPAWTIPQDADRGFWAATAWRDGKVLLIAEDNTVAEADPALCATRPKACVSKRAPLVGEPSEPYRSQSLVVLAGGGWAYRDADHLHLIDGKGAETARLAFAGAEVTQLAVTAAGAVVAGWAGTVWRIDPARCSGGLDGELPADQAPAGCLTRLATLDADDLAIRGPAPLGEDGVAFLYDGVQIWRGGAKVAVADVSAESAVVPGDGVVYVVAMTEIFDDEEPPHLRAISTTDGTTTWRTRLGAGFPALTDDNLAELAGDGEWLYVACDGSVAALPRSK